MVKRILGVFKNIAVNDLSEAKSKIQPLHICRHPHKEL